MTFSNERTKGSDPYHSMRLVHQDQSGQHEPASDTRFRHLSRKVNIL